MNLCWVVSSSSTVRTVLVSSTCPSRAKSDNSPTFLSNNFFEEKRKNLGISKTHTHNQKRNQFEGQERKRERERERESREKQRQSRERARAGEKRRELEMV